MRAGPPTPVNVPALILCVCSEIVVLGVSFASDDVHGEMQLQPTDLSIPSDEVNMLQIVGTPQGIWQCARMCVCGASHALTTARNPLF